MAYLSSRCLIRKMGLTLSVPQDCRCDKLAQGWSCFCFQGRPCLPAPSVPPRWRSPSSVAPGSVAPAKPPGKQDNPQPVLAPSAAGKLPLLPLRAPPVQSHFFTSTSTSNNRNRDQGSNCMLRGYLFVLSFAAAFSELTQII